MVFGKTIKIDNKDNVIYFNHFENLSDDHEKNIILRKCKGCELGIFNANIFKNKVRSCCLIVEHIERTFLISPYRWNKQHHSKRLLKIKKYLLL